MVVRAQDCKPELLRLFRISHQRVPRSLMVTQRSER